MDDTRSSFIRCAAARMLVCGGRVMGARLINEPTGVVIRLSAASLGSMPVTVGAWSAVSVVIGFVGLKNVFFIVMPLSLTIFG